MNTEMAIAVTAESMYLGLLVITPLLMTALVVGLIISVIQSVTQIQEMTLTFIPKIVAVTIVLIYLMPWIVAKCMDYTVEIFHMIGNTGTL